MANLYKTISRKRETTKLKAPLDNLLIPVEKAVRGRLGVRGREPGGLALSGELERLEADERITNSLDERSHIELYCFHGLK